MDCPCPAPAAFTQMPNPTCKERFGQVNKILFQRSGYLFDSVGGTPNPITALASWTPLFAAADDTRVTITPEFEAFTIPEATPNTRGGGDNETVRGVQIVTGSGPIIATGRFANQESAVLAALRELECELNLVVYFVDEFGRIACTTHSTSANPGEIVTGFPIQALFVPDNSVGGHNTDDNSTFRFALNVGWRDNVHFATPTDFNALTGLLNP